MIYLDNSATTQVDEDTAMAAYQSMTETYGNPSSPYLLGREALGCLTAARHQVAQVIGAPARRIFFIDAKRASAGDRHDRSAAP